MGLELATPESCSNTDYRIFSCSHEIKERNKVKILIGRGLIVGLVEIGRLIFSQQYILSIRDLKQTEAAAERRRSHSNLYSI